MKTMVSHNSLMRIIPQRHTFAPQQLVPREAAEPHPLISLGPPPRCHRANHGSVISPTALRSPDLCSAPLLVARQVR